MSFQQEKLISIGKRPIQQHQIAMLHSSSCYKMERTTITMSIKRVHRIIKNYTNGIYLDWNHFTLLHITCCAMFNHVLRHLLIRGRKPDQKDFINYTNGIGKLIMKYHIFSFKISYHLKHFIIVNQVQKISIRIRIGLSFRILGKSVIYWILDL